MSCCRSCGAQIAWVETKAGKRMPLNLDRVVIVTDDGVTVSGRQSHFVTCHNARQHRRGGRR